MPTEVRAVINVLRLGVSVGLGSTDSVLACLGMPRFLHRLVFWMVTPLALVLAILVGSVIRLAATRSLSLRALYGASLPLITRLLFLVYPIVTNVTFEAARSPVIKRWP